MAVLAVAGLVLMPAFGFAAQGAKPIFGHYRCGAEGVKLGLPAGVFRVRYTGGGADGRAVVPVRGRRVVFVQGLSADGSRYTNGRYTWWDARTPTFSVGDGPDEKTVSCKAVD